MFVSGACGVLSGATQCLLLAVACACMCGVCECALQFSAAKPTEQSTDRRLNWQIDRQTDWQHRMRRSTTLELYISAAAVLNNIHTHTCVCTHTHSLLFFWPLFRILWWAFRTFRYSTTTASFCCCSGCWFHCCCCCCYCCCCGCRCCLLCCLAYLTLRQRSSRQRCT